jgi:biotin operon repressor
MMNYQPTPDELLAGIAKEVPINGHKPTPNGPQRRFKRTNTTKIMATDYPPIKWIVPDYLPEGFSVLAGRQKLGKTWLAIDWAVAVATGGYAMGSIPVDQGDVLYIDMENGERRIKGRIEKLCPTSDYKADLSRLEWVTEAIALNEGFISAIEDWRVSVMAPRLVVIDVLQRIKPVGAAARNAYENDYAIFAELQTWATENGIAVLALHHTRKGGADDPLEALTGSNGLSAVADTTLVLDRDANGMTLYGRGRDVEEKDTALSFDAGMWTLQGDAHEVRQSSERQAILTELLTAEDLLTPADLTAATGKKRAAIDKMLHQMAKAGQVIRAKRGQYAHPQRPDLWETQTPGKNGKTVRKEQSDAD